MSRAAAGWEADATPATPVRRLLKTDFNIAWFLAQTSQEAAGRSFGKGFRNI